uniref:DDE Tnp4 domain-containing protein n=1 Tax=Globisporangium ultimum (strain ATCC 200006 / CBS 805.95 / DAOM BR144) TaxID=431595 RepID=K3WJF4_GLOUD
MSNRLIIHFWEPTEGKRHDIALLRERKLVKCFDARTEVIGGYVVYGDPTYGVQKYLSGFKKAVK